MLKAVPRVTGPLFTGPGRATSDMTVRLVPSSMSPVARPGFRVEQSSLQGSSMRTPLRTLPDGFLAGWQASSC
ncbi:hypothetical protein [Chitinivorax sp. B]|uniref:hypothetical protein n=1 Tax=Chitinivorax sp. B TaxID=2502235 RepID=UPI0010F46414|nr:hypothetical protein [Chitinivorax sp. B]